MADGDETSSEKAFAIWLTENPQGKTGFFVSALYILIVFSKGLAGSTSLHDVQKFFAYHPKIIASTPSLFQCFALLPPFVWCFRAMPPSWPKNEVAIRACVQFSRCMAALIASWIVFYLLNFVEQIHQKDALGPWIDFFNNLQAIFLFACYWTLTAITIPDPKDPNSNGPNHKTLALSLVFSYLLWIVLVFHLADIEFGLLHNTAARFWFQLLSGLAVGICMALMVGCLESEYLDSPRALTACLYCYSVLQLAYVGFNDPVASLSKSASADGTLQMFATLTSLPLKFLFVGLCYWHLQSGRLAFYMEKTRTLIRTDVPNQWDEFLKRRQEPAPVHEASTI